MIPVLAACGVLVNLVSLNRANPRNLHPERSLTSVSFPLLIIVLALSEQLYLCVFSHLACQPLTGSRIGKVQTGVLVCSGCSNKNTIHGVAYKHQTFLSPSSGVWKSQINGSAQLGSWEGPLSCFRMPDSPCILPWQAAEREREAVPQ